MAVFFVSGFQIKNRKLNVSGVCTPLGTRTLDTLIKSQVLYQLS